MDKLSQEDARQISVNNVSNKSNSSCSSKGSSASDRQQKQPAPTISTKQSSPSVSQSINKDHQSSNHNELEKSNHESVISKNEFMDNLRQLFQECDTDRNGYLGRDKFKDLCLKIGLDESDAYETFDRLDIDRNGFITFAEFCAGFNQYQTSATNGALSQESKQDNNASLISESEHRRSVTSSQGKRGPQSARTSPTGVTVNSNKNIHSSEDYNTSTSLETNHQSSSSGITMEDSIRSTHLKPKPSGRPSSRSRSASSRLSNISPIGTISLGRNDSSLENIRDDSSSVITSQEDDGMVVLSSRDSSKQVMTFQDLLDFVQALQDENHKLSMALMKEKTDRDQHLSRLGEEIDQQVKEVEARVEQKAKEEVESERRRLREMMKAEFDGLQTHFQTLEKVNEWIKTTSGGKTVDGDKIERVKTKLEDTLSENRQLRMSLLDTQTNVAMIRNEIDQLKEQYGEKCQELTHERERVFETLNEYDHIKRQLNLMHDSNRKLQDASDANHLGPSYNSPTISRSNSRPNALGGPQVAGSSSVGLPNLPMSRRGSILSDYIQDYSLDNKSAASITSDLESLNSQMSIRNLYDDPDDRSSQRSVPTYNSRAGSNISHPSYSPHERPSQRQYQAGAANFKSNHHHQVVNNFLQPLSNNLYHNIDITASNNSKSRQGALKKSRSDQNIQQQEGIQHGTIGKIGVSILDHGEQTSLPVNTSALVAHRHEAISKAHSMSQDSLPIVEQSDGPSTTTYDIILVGDSYVGKSSFVARFMEGDFVVGLISNCGIDFKTKSYKVDGINVTVNLWDTAGQERFRSITASYFRKADGIILMYDVTEKNSYLNVRNWMSTITETAAENVLVLLIGNKIDLRTQHNLNACVPSDEGRRLAREYDIVFLETSVKDGTNLIGSIGKLVRLMMTKNEKPPEKQDTIKLNDKSKTFRCMPQKC